METGSIGDVFCLPAAPFAATTLRCHLRKYLTLRKTAFVQRLAAEDEVQPLINSRSRR